MRKPLVAAMALAGPWIWLWLGACGGAQHEKVTHEAPTFACRGRTASYEVAHHMAGDQLGVQADCAEAGPRIKRWRIDIAGNRQEDAHSLNPGEFENIWKEIDGTGWPNLRDCTNGTAGKQDPIYTFDIKDDQNQASFRCQSQSMPYPYNDIVDPLDLAAQGGRGQFGDDEPGDGKATKPTKPPQATKPPPAKAKQK
jgi:hypothetical protein